MIATCRGGLPGAASLIVWPEERVIILCFQICGKPWVEALSLYLHDFRFLVGERGVDFTDYLVRQLLNLVSPRLVVVLTHL